MEIKALIASAVSSVLEEQGAQISAEEISALLEKPADPALGDVAIPCFKLAKVLRSAPQSIAAKLKEGLAGRITLAKTEAVGGYLNFKLSGEYYASLLADIAGDESYGSSKIGEGKTVCLDFSSPNIAKRFHVGHLGSTVIGGSLRNIYAFCGYKTVAINYVGDWGTPFGKMIVAYKRWSSEDKVNERGVDELMALYVRFEQEAKEDPSLLDEARAAFANMESGNEEYLSIWRKFRQISLDVYNKTYELLGIKFDSYNGEAFFSDKMDAVVSELAESGLLVKDAGAQIVSLADYNMPPVLIIKSDGATTYHTRDIAAALWRKKEYSFDKSIYVTAAGQSLHFAQLFKAIELMGREWSGSLVHVPYGTMSMGGEKLASRTGNIVLLDDLLSEAIIKCERVIEDKNSALPNKKEVAEAVGVGAIIFNRLSTGRIKDTDFNWEDALSFEGNSGPYVQYTYARAASVIRKADSRKADSRDTGENNDAQGFTTLLEEEKELIKFLSEFPQAVLRAMEDNEPSVIARYALSLCTAFNRFYHNCPILRAEGAERAFRLMLAKGTKNVLGSSLELLCMRRTEEI